MHCWKSVPLDVELYCRSRQTISDEVVLVAPRWQTSSHGEPAVVCSPRTTEINWLKTSNDARVRQIDGFGPRPKKPSILRLTLFAVDVADAHSSKRESYRMESEKFLPGRKYRRQARKEDLLTQLIPKSLGILVQHTSVSSRPDKRNEKKKSILRRTNPCPVRITLHQPNICQVDRVHAHPSLLGA